MTGTVTEMYFKHDLSLSLCYSFSGLYVGLSWILKNFDPGGLHQVVPY